MTPDSDADPDRPESASVSPSLPPNDHRAIEAAVAGVAGLLLGRVLFGRAGGLVAGIAAVGAGLLAKRLPTAKKADAPAKSASPCDDPGPTPVTETIAETLPLNRARLESGVVPAVDHWGADLPVVESIISPMEAEPAEAPEIEAAGLVGAPIEELPDSVSLAVEEPEAEAPAPEVHADITPPEPKFPDLAPAMTFPPVIEERAPAFAEDAGAFAEMPALFTSPDVSVLPVADSAGPDISLTEWPPPEEPGKIEVPVAEPAAAFDAPGEAISASQVTDAAEEFGSVAFDDQPVRPVVEILPVAELVDRAGMDLAAEALPVESARQSEVQRTTPPAPEPFVLCPIADLPPEYAALCEEPDPGPREDFLIIPDQPSNFPPPIQPVVAALSVSLEDADRSLPVNATNSKTISEITAGDQNVVATQPSSSDHARAENPAPVAEAAAAPGTTAPPSPSDISWELPPLSPLALEPALPNPTRGAAAPSHELEEKSAASALPGPDPEEIWRQAAVELALLRDAPAPWVPPPVPPSPALPGIPDVTAPPPPPFPSLAAPTGTAPLPAAELKAPGPDKPAEPPPWMKEVVGVPPLPEEIPAPKPVEDAASLPTIRLSVSQSPQALPARRPVPLPPSSPAASTEPAASTRTQPVALHGSRAEPLRPLPIPAVGDPLESSGPILPPAPNPPVAVSAPPPAIIPQGALAPPPAFAATSQPVAVADEASPTFVPRRPSSRSPQPPPYQKRLITPFRLALLALLAAGALGMAFKPQLIKLWEHQILGKPARKSRPAPLPEPVATSASSRPGDAPDVIIVPETPPAPSPAADPKVPAAESDKNDEPPASPTNGETNPAIITMPPGIQAVSVSPPPPAEPEASGPLPLNETGARELISRLLSATSPNGVLPYIFDAATHAPALETYFSSGRAVPVASFEANLERADKIAGKRTMWLFRVITDNIPRGFPVGVEETADGLRADWEFFAQCRDGALESFLDDPAAAPSRFYTSLKRVHTFADMLPEQDHTAFFAFEIASPALGATPATAFIPKGTPLATRADNLYKWETTYAPVLELVRQNGRLEITGIVRENWRAAARSGSR